LSSGIGATGAESKKALSTAKMVDWRMMRVRVRGSVKSEVLKVERETGELSPP